jgi:hypothetical protein
VTEATGYLNVGQGEVLVVVRHNAVNPESVLLFNCYNEVRNPTTLCRQQLYSTLFYFCSKHSTCIISTYMSIRNSVCLFH